MTQPPTENLERALRQVGMSRASAWRLAKVHSRLPSLETAVLVERATGIPCSFWVERKHAAERAA